MRTANKWIRDFIVQNTLGQGLVILAALLLAATPFAPLLHVTPAQVAAITAMTTSAIGGWRLLRARFAVLEGIDPSTLAPDPVTIPPSLSEKIAAYEEMGKTIEAEAETVQRFIAARTPAVPDNVTPIVPPTS